MALVKKSVQLPEETGLSPKGNEQSSSWLPGSSSSSVIPISRLMVRENSPEQASPWRESGHRGERVTEAASTSAGMPRPRQRRQKILSSPVGAHTGPSNFTKLPTINLKPRSTPSSPSSPTRSSRSFNSRRVSLGQNAITFIAGATIAGPLTSAPAPSRSSNNSTAITAAAMFALSAGQTITAASIAYNVGNGIIPNGNEPGPRVGPGGGGGGGTTADQAAPPQPGGTAALPIPAQSRALLSQGSGVGRGLSGAGDGLFVGGTAAGPANGALAVGADDDIVADPEPADVLGDNTRLRGRLVSLPNIVCRSANGDVFLVELGNVQAMLHKRELGEEGLSLLHRITPGLAQAIGATGPASPTRRRSGRRGRNGRRAVFQHTDTDESMGGISTRSRAGSPLLARASSTGRGRLVRAVEVVGTGGTGSSVGMPSFPLDPAMEEELRRHIEATEAVVEQRRYQLQEDWRLGRTLGVSPAAAAREQEEARRAAAIDFAVNIFVPRRLALMTLNMRPSAPEESGEELGGAGKGGKGAETREENESPVFGRDFNEPRQKGFNWNKLQAGMDRLYDKMPFMHEWVAAMKKMQREQGAGWGGLMHGVDDLYVKGREEHQGTNIYVLKCHELGVTPSTQVIQQLSCPEANMSHCHLGRQGAAALRHALSANVTITNLNLRDNHLDATGLESVLAGLYSGTMARQPRARKVLERRLQQAAGTLAVAVQSSSGVPQTPRTTEGASPSPVGPGRTAGFPSPTRRAVPGDLNVRLIPVTLLKEQEVRRQAEERQRREEEEARMTQQASAGTMTEVPEWLKLIHEPRVSLPGDTALSSSSQVGMQMLPGMGLPGQTGPPASAAGLPGLRLPRLSASAASPSTRLTCAITSLDLSDNPLGINGVRALADLLDPTITPHQFIKQLILNKCGIPETGGRALAVALSRGNTRLAVLGLSNNALGNGTAAMFGEVLALPSGLEDLDFSWNQIKAEGARALAEGVAQNNTLTRLNLSWNGLESPGVMALGTMLLQNESLTWLDLTSTRMGAEACLLLGEGIKGNHTLEMLSINGNMVGDDGARFIMDALKINTSLRYLGLQGTNMSTAARGHTQASTFNPLSPDGTYHLNLELAPDRAVALKLCEMDAAAPMELMKNIRLGDRSISSCKAMRWPESLPVSGILTCDFVTRRVSRVLAVMEAKKFMALATQFRSAGMSDKEKLGLVEVMAPFNYVLCHQAATLVRCFSMGDEQVLAASLLFTRCADLDEDVTTLAESLGAEASTDALQKALGWFSYLRFTNSTGHYELALSSRVHAALAARLKDVAYSEPVDVLNWHNIIYDQYTTVVKVPANFGPPEDWKGLIPHVGTLSFDYVSGCLAAEDATPISDELLTEIITKDLGLSLDALGHVVPHTDHGAACRQLALLRPLVANMPMTAAQVKKLVEAFASSPHRVEVLVICYALVTDRANLWTIMYCLEPIEQALALWRLGPSNLFDKAHPTGHYVLDLHNPHHEAVAHKLVDMAISSPDLPNFWNLRLNGMRRSVTENRNMWGTFMAETNAPFVEFDFIGTDGFELLGRSKAEVDALGPGDRLDLRTKQARRMELSRNKTMYGYYEDGSSWTRPAWQSRQLLMRALAEKAPWQAAWDRMARLLLRADLRRGDLEGDSVLEDMFFTATAGEDAMTGEQWEALLKEWGYNRPEINFMAEAFLAESRHATPKDGPAFKPFIFNPSPPALSIPLSPADPALFHGPSTASPSGRSGPQRTSRQPSMGVSAAVVGFASMPPEEKRSFGGVPGEGPSPNRPSRYIHQEALRAASIPTPGSSYQGPIMVPNMVVEFPTFVSLFMKEPPRALRLIAPQGASGNGEAGEGTATKGRKATNARR